jgi:anaerobic selenocysteine-containing dehydrogenase
MNETTRRFADVVLPGAAWLEDIGCKATHTHVYLMDRILQPAGEAWPTQDVLKGLADRLAVTDFYPWASQEELIDAVLDHPATGGATIASLRANGGRMALKISHIAYPDRRFVCWPSATREPNFGSRRVMHPGESSQRATRSASSIAAARSRLRRISPTEFRRASSGCATAASA